MHPRIAGLQALFAAALARRTDSSLFQMCATFVHLAPPCDVSDASRAGSHLDSRAPASYVLCRNSSSVSRGDSDRRTASYIRINSLSCLFHPADGGRTVSSSSPGGAGAE